MYPRLCSPELEEKAAEWGPSKRREIAGELAGWAAQLHLSADLIERFEGQPGLTQPTEIPDAVQKQLRDAAELVRMGEEMRWAALKELGIPSPGYESLLVERARARIERLN